MDARCRHQRVANDTPIIGIGIDRFQRASHQLAEVVPNGADRRRIIRLQRRELLIQRTFGFVGAFFGKVEQADGEVGQPVFQVTEGLLRGAGGAKYLDIVGFGA